MIFSMILLVLGIAGIGYFIYYAAAIGINDVFLYFWLILGAGCVVWSFLHQWIYKKELHWLGKIEYAALLVFCICAVVFLGVLGRIVREAHQEPEAGADYVVILGAHVFGERMSANLRYRVEAACEYLKENTETKAVLSGGQGNGEDITEAEAMRRYLLEEGISKDRLLLDETSVNTEQNIANSIELMGSREKKVIVVSNTFHIYRAVGIAKKQGIDTVEGLGAKTYPQTVINSYAREVFAVIKYRLCGQI